MIHDSWKKFSTFRAQTEKRARYATQYEVLEVTEHEFGAGF